MSDVSVRIDVAGEVCELSGETAVVVVIRESAEDEDMLSFDVRVAGSTRATRLAEAVGSVAKGVVEWMSDSLEIEDHIAAALVTAKVMDDLTDLMHERGDRERIAALARSMGVEVPDGESGK